MSVKRVFVTPTAASLLALFCLCLTLAIINLKLGQSPNEFRVESIEDVGFTMLVVGTTNKYSMIFDGRVLRCRQVTDEDSLSPKRRWCLTYEVVPNSGNAAFGKSRGKTVNCWIDAESLEIAVDIAAHDLDSRHWTIVKLVEAKPGNVQETPQALTDRTGHRVYWFNDKPTIAKAARKR